MKKIWAVILAAGKSERMGQPKMLLTFSGKTMLETVIGNVRASAVDNSIVVLGANNDLLLPLVVRTYVKYCINDNYSQGMLSSVNCGISFVPEGIDAVIVFQGDQPFIPPNVTDKVLESYKKSGKGIVIPVFERRRGHPLLIDKKYFNNVKNLDPDLGLRSLASQFPDDVLEVDTDENGIFRDFDTYDEYLNELNQIH